MSMILAFAACSLIAVLHSARPQLEESHDAATEQMKVLHSPSFSLHGHGELHKMNQTSANSDSLDILNHSKSHSATRPDTDEETVSIPDNDSLRTGGLSSELDHDESEIDSVAEQSQPNVVGRELRNAGIGSKELGLPKHVPHAQRAGFGYEPAQRKRRGAFNLGNRGRKLQEEPAVQSDCEELKNSRGILQSGLRNLCIEIANFQTGYHNKNEDMALKTDEKIDNWLQAAESLHGEQEEFQRITDHYKRGMRNNIALGTQVLQSHPKWGIGTDEGPKPMVGPKERQLPINLPEQYMRPAFGHDSVHNKIHQWGTGLEPNVPLSRGLVGLPGALQPNHLKGRGGQLGALTINDLDALNTDERGYIDQLNAYDRATRVQTGGHVQTGGRVQSGGAYLSASNLNKHAQSTSGSHLQNSGSQNLSNPYLGGIRTGASQNDSGRDVDSQSEDSSGWDSLSES